MDMPEEGEKFKFNPAYIMLQPRAMLGEAKVLYYEARHERLKHIWVNSNIAPEETWVDGIQVHETLLLTPQEVWCTGDTD